MKPIRVSAFSRTAAAIACLVTFTSGTSLAADIFWDGSVNPGTWSAAANWSTTNAAAGANPAAAPVITDIANFTVTGVTTAQNVTVDGAQAALGIKTISQGATTSLLGNGSSSLKIGASGIDHNAGGIIIGSATAGLEVPISLQGGQTWNSRTSGTGAAAIVAQNGVSIGAGGAQTLTLTGNNNGAVINGNITDGAAMLSLTKTGGATAVWTLAGTANTFTGPTHINGGILRLTNAGALTPANTTVAATATLSMRVGGTGFTSPQVDTYISTVHLAASGSNIALDTANANFTYASNISGNFNLAKWGGNTLTLTGTNTYTGTTTVNEGILAIASPAAIPVTGPSATPITVASGASLVGVVGNGGLTEAALFALPSRAVFNPPAQPFGISTGNGDYTIKNPLTGSLRYQKAGANTLTLAGDGTNTGGLLIAAGTLRVLSINNGGLPGGLGAASSDAANITLSGGRLMYGGPTASTDRLFNFTAGFILDSSGPGPINFANTGTYTTTGTASARTITLTGYNDGTNVLAGIIPNSSASTLTTVIKQGSGSWSLTGANSYTGITRVNGGTLTLDYATADPVPAAATNVVLNSGTLIFKAGASPTAETIPVFTLSANQQTSSRLRLEGGFTLNITRLDGGAHTQRHDLIDLSAAGTNVINVTGLNTGTPNTNIVNGILMANAVTAANARANIVVRKGNVYGFARLSGVSTGVNSGVIENVPVLPAVGGMTERTPGPTAFNSVTTNYYLKTAGTYEFSQDAAYSTITVDSTAGEIELNMNSYALTPTGSGKALLFYGSNNIALTNYELAFTGSQPMWIHNYLDASQTLAVTASFGSGSFVIIGGSGFMNYTGYGYGTNFFVNGGIVRAGSAFLMPYGSINMRVTGGGVLEIGADLNGVDPGHFTKTVTSAEGGLGFFGDSGVSAYTPAAGGKRVVNFSVQTLENSVLTLTSQNLVWGTARFLTLPETDTDGDFTFKLSSIKSNATVEVQNAINFNGRQRVVEVANGSAAIDAELSGVLSGSSGSASGLIKTGAGTLALTGTNTYTGETWVKEGTLRVGPGAVNAASSLRVDSGGVLNVTDAVHVSGAIINGVVQPPGLVPASAFVTGSGTLTVDALNTPYEQWVIDRALGSGESAATFDADFDGLVNLIEYVVGTNPKVPNGSVISQVSGTPASIRFARASGRTDVTVVVEGSVALATGAWQTIATSTAGGAFTAQAGVSATINESAGTVTVTDAVGSARRFYRIRVEK